MDINLTTKINELINLLNPEGDSILIIALRSKIRQVDQEYLSKYEVSDKDVSSAKKGFNNTIHSWIREDCKNNKRLVKIKTILEGSRECDDCINKVEKHYKDIVKGCVVSGKYYTGDENNIKCKSCTKWIDLLSNEENKETYKEILKYNVEIPIEFYKQKALITKIQNKLSLIKKISNYETSKH